MVKIIHVDEFKALKESREKIPTSPFLAFACPIVGFGRTTLNF
jgi:hypothetical protein